MKCKKLVYGLLIVFGLIVIGTCSAIIQEINSFEDCVEAGYPILVSYPAQCRTPEGKVFVEQVTLPEEPPAPRLKLTKSASLSVIQVGETTTITIRVENIGTGDATSVEVTDTIPTGLKILSGSKSANFDEIKPGNYRTLEYTLKATGSGNFTCEDATATHKDADGNSYYPIGSNSVSIQVGGEVPVGADSDGDGLNDPADQDTMVPEEKTPGFETVFAIAGLLVVAYLLRKRK